MKRIQKTLIQKFYLGKPIAIPSENITICCRLSREKGTSNGQYVADSFHTYCNIWLLM